MRLRLSTNDVEINDDRCARGDATSWPPHCLVVSGNQFSSKRYAIERRENSRVVLARRRLCAAFTLLRRCRTRGNCPRLMQLPKRASPQSLALRPTRGRALLKVGGRRYPALDFLHRG